MKMIRFWTFSFLLLARGLGFAEEGTDVLNQAEAQNLNLVRLFWSINQKPSAVGFSTFEEARSKTQVLLHDLSVEIQGLDQQLLQNKANLDVLRKRTKSDQDSFLKSLSSQMYLRSRRNLAALLDFTHMQKFVVSESLYQSILKTQSARLVRYAKEKDELSQSNDKLWRNKERLKRLTALFEQQKEALAQVESSRPEWIKKARDNADLIEQILVQAGKSSQQIGKMLQKITPSTYVRSDLSLNWPVAHGDSRLLAIPKTDVESNGLRIRGQLGENVQAAMAGKVAFVGYLHGFGNVVIVEHEPGLHTVYAHLQRATVQNNQAVAAGEVVGLLGDTESLVGPMLYFELRKDGIAKNPLASLRP